jgi:hypothetical protein
MFSGRSAQASPFEIWPTNLHLRVFGIELEVAMKIDPSGWATIDSAPRDRQVIVWGTQTGLPNSKPFAAMAHFDGACGWVASDPNDKMLFQLNPTHWLPVPPPPAN